MKTGKKLRGFFRLLLLAAMLVLSGCSGKTEEPTEAKWAVYWYLCGSNLESQHGSATADLKEMQSISLPEGVKVVVQTGGSMEWKRKDVKADKRTRFVYDERGWKRKEVLEEANMGEKDTFADFLTYCQTNHPAERTMVLLWNHGGGVLGGIAYDENYGLDSLSLTELKNALEEAAGSGKEKKSFDLIGFDACLMANIDTAYAVSPYADYMIASQELEPGNGWNYAGMMNALAANPEISPQELGKVICDSFMEGCIEAESDGEATLSLLDLEPVPELFEKYQACGDSVFEQVLEDETLFASYARAAEATEGYGGNSKEEGYTNMIDMGGIVRGTSFLSEEEKKQMETELERCVLYQVRGPYRSYGSGISCYYPLDYGLSNLYQFKDNSSFESYKNLYQYQITRKLNSAALDYLNQKGFDLNEQGKGRITVENLGLDQYPVQVTEDGTMVLDLGNRAKYLTRVGGYLAWVDFEEERMLGIGSELVETADWENGVFTYPYRSEWWYMDDHLIYTFCPEKREDYSLYSVPVLLNGERVFLRVAVEADGTAKLLGARKELAEHGMAERQMLRLKEGDEITTLLYQAKISAEDSGLALKEYETFVLSGEPRIEKKPLMDGLYAWTYDMNDMWNQYASSDLVLYEVIDGHAVK